MRKTTVAFIIAAALCLPACSSSRVRYPAAESGLDLSRVVLYRNGVGYFERQGSVDGDVLYLKVRKDHVNDLLKSLTVVERAGGRAVSVSMPLDPETWANAALATLAPGRGSLAEVLDALRGTWVQLKTKNGSASGRVLMVEQFIVNPNNASAKAKPSAPERPVTDHRVTVMDGEKMSVVVLSEVTAITLEDGDLTMAFHRSLDATAGEGMFQQVDVAVRLAGKSSKDVVVSYVAPAPMWKPTYRVVLPENGKGQALLQAWAVVDNTSGEDWRNVRLALTSGAPIAFQYDLHTPREVIRTDLTGADVRKRARVAIGETSYEDAPSPPPAIAAAPAMDEAPQEALETTTEEYEDDDYDDSAPTSGISARRAMKSTPMPSMINQQGLARSGVGSGGGAPAAASKAKVEEYGYASAESPAVDFQSLQRSTVANTRASTVSGLTRFDINEQVTLPEGSSTMVAIINQPIEAEETFMFQPGGAGAGYETNPYRVVRFRNTTPFVLETGPISIYASGSFVGEGISETVGSGTSATIPFAVEPSVMITSSVDRSGEEMKLLRVVRGTLELESFSRTTTTWNMRSQLDKNNLTVLIRQPKSGHDYTLQPRPKGTEDLANAYLIPFEMPAGKREAQLKVVEQTPSKITISIWSTRALQVLDNFMITGKASAEVKAKLQPIITLRQEIGRIDTQIESLSERRRELDQRAGETRKSLNAIKKDAAAGALRTKLNKRLEEFTTEGDKLGRDIVELQSKRLEKKIELDDLLQSFDLTL